MKVKKPKNVEQHDVEKDNKEEDKTEVAEKPVKIVDGSIFKYFNDLTNDSEHVRINAGTQLLQQLSKSQDDDKRKKEISYCLKRLCRGVGASTSASRAGFFTTLVAFLQTTTTDDVSIEDVIKTVQKELNVGTSISNKEDADAFVGKILVCGAVLRSGRLSQANAEYLEQITNILVQASRHRTYHCSLAYVFLIEMIEKLTVEQFEQSVWPLLQIELIKPWPKQTVQTVHCLIVAHLKFPSVVDKQFFKMHLGGAKLINSDSEPHLLRLFVGNTNSDILTHPALEAFGAYIATSSKLVEFIENQFDPFLETPNRLKEIISLKFLTDILAHLDNEKTPVSRLLSPNFVKMIVASLKNTKSKKDETFKAFYAEFFENLSACCLKATDAERVEVVHKLILHPGTFNIEKFTTNRIVHQIIGFMGESGIQAIFKTYKDIFLDRLPKNVENKSETWLNFERQNAAYMLQHLLSHKSVQKSFTWRQEQLKFFMAIGLFNVNNSGEICPRSEAGQLQKDFGVHMKNIFYTSLQSKVPALKDEKAVLLTLVDTCNEYLQKKKATNFFRQKINENVLKAWNEMYAEVKNSKKVHGNEKKLQLVFHILLLHMGLQLFREPEMAETAILDLEKCMARTKGKKKSSEDSEPEWIEVVIDLFLHLLSQNASALRNIVNTVFPQLCDSLNLTAVHQILAMLDMKDGQNPLSGKNDEDDEDGEEEEDDDDEEGQKENGNKDDEDSEDDEENNSASEDDEDEEVDDDEDDEEEVTASDKLRNAISLALGSAIPKDDDQDSIDLNDMTEEEGKKLDEALAAAFGAMKKAGGDSQNKKSKNHRVQTTTVMHFRIRVLDLLEIYTQHEPSLLITIEIMLALFNMLEFCTDEELKPLQIKVEKTLNKLTLLRQFSSVQDVTEANLVDFIRLIIEKKARSIAFDVHNRLKNKCCMFLIANAKLMSEGGTNEQVLALLVDYLEDFIKTRNPAVNVTLLSDIFKLPWQGVWPLASTLTEKGMEMSVRTFRRIQVVESLSLVYKNHKLISENSKLAKKHLKKIETILCQHLEAISKASSISQKEFNTLMDLFFFAKRCHSKYTIENSSLSSCKDCVQEIRSRVQLDLAQSYNRFCTAYEVKPLKNPATVQNGLTNGDVSEEEEEEDNSKVDVTTSKKDKNKKRKNSDSAAESFKKGKKLKKEERMKAFSEGLNGGFNFDSATPEDVVITDDILPNHDDSSSAQEDEEEDSD
ncbi:myb-binding protein 1A [Eupeodes corollae]|uniref:myb-binding protein 1A n=1 Tax=Eupeodes corollae TaxID=290404 RepID=UPI0024928EF9|nr:myb-binding protein 1A [Eupeodes corollae]